MGARSTIHLLDVTAAEAFVDDVAHWVRTGQLRSAWRATLQATGRTPAEEDRELLGAEPRLLDWLRPGSLPPRSTEVTVPRPSERTQDAVEAGMLALAVGDGVDFGNAESLVILASDLLPALEPWVITPPGTGERAPYLWRLDRGLAGSWSHGSGGFGEGLRGMLDGEGCELLLEELSDLRLDLEWEIARQGPAPVSPLPGSEDEARWVLSIATDAAVRALERNRGLLHGRDLRLDAWGAWSDASWKRG